MIEIIFSEEHLRRFGKRRARVLEVGGHVHAVKHAGSPAHDGIGSQLIRESETWSKVVSVHWRVATTGSWKDARTSDFANLPELRKQPRGIPVEGHVDSRISSEIVELEPILPFCVRCAPFVAQPKVKRQLGSRLPVVLHKESSLFRFVGNCGNQMY